ncbi:hypothetical protein NADFUDRAFT_49529 [Nadsonia fulvescens var. elongata DSM 6958]|uniref:Zn(2)-C6 fungal-type domain-containing protein n=1 Tax=Nadsonia fulvescens var. elongata DSM 6958 TaxID=857566 RepID=A0A1E3PNT3_9ASCO|nr:hypothetical protein NADFUDRAFT_49529 [Nadsonia fulvescens var. elongata DSM 6958]
MTYNDIHYLDPLIKLNPSNIPKSRRSTTSQSKHVSTACLQCRRRHIRCEGSQPVCAVCREKGRDCTFVKSRRGGPRVKGINKSKLASHLAYEVEFENWAVEDPTVKDSAIKGSAVKKTGREIDEASRNSPIKFSTATSIPTQSSFDPLYNPTAWQPDTILTLIDVRTAIDHYYETFHQSHPFLAVQLGPYTRSVGTLTFVLDLVTVMDYIRLIIINDRPNNPKKRLTKMELHAKGLEILTYIRTSPNDIVKIQCLLLLTLVFHLTCYDTWDNIVQRELIDLALMLNLNQVDASLSPSSPEGHTFFSIDSNTKSPSSVLVKVNPNIKQIAVCSSSRLSIVDDATLTETCRRTFWEIFTFDVVLGSVSKLKRSKLAIAGANVAFPTMRKVACEQTPSENHCRVDSSVNNSSHSYSSLKSISGSIFKPGDNLYDLRINSVKMVDESVHLLSCFDKLSLSANNSENDKDKLATKEMLFMRLSAQISNWNLKFNSSLSSSMATIWGLDETIDYGVQLSKSILSYTGILLHQPFSHLTADEGCNFKSDNGSGFPNTSRISTVAPSVVSPLRNITEHQKLRQTQHAISAANGLIQICDLEPAHLYKFSPINSYLLSLAFLVHLNAYLWLSESSTLRSIPVLYAQVPSVTAPTSSEFSRKMRKERQLYVESMKIAYRALHLVGQTWHIGARLKQDIRKILIKQTPELVDIVCEVDNDSTYPCAVDDFAQQDTQNVHFIHTHRLDSLSSGKGPDLAFNNFSIPLEQTEQITPINQPYHHLSADLLNSAMPITTTTMESDPFPELDFYDHDDPHYNIDGCISQDQINGDNTSLHGSSSILLPEVVTSFLHPIPFCQEPIETEILEEYSSLQTSCSPSPTTVAFPCDQIVHNQALLYVNMPFLDDRGDVISECPVQCSQQYHEPMQNYPPQEYLQVDYNFQNYQMGDTNGPHQSEVQKCQPYYQQGQQQQRCYQYQHKSQEYQHILSEEIRTLNDGLEEFLTPASLSPFPF